MSSFSGCFFLVSMVVSLPFLLGSFSTIASTKYIDAICSGNTFCLQTLTAYPPAVSATNQLKLVKIAIGLGVSQAEKTIGLVAELAKEPTFKRHFEVCNESYTGVVAQLRLAISEVNISPLYANYDAMRSYDETQIVKDEVGKNTDKASKRLMEMTLLMDKYINIACAATDSLT